MIPTLDELLDNTVLTLSVVSAFVYLSITRAAPSYSRMVSKTASTALLSLLAYQHGGPYSLVGALALGSLGDAFLAWDNGSDEDSDSNFLCGLGSFLAAHILYVFLFAQSGGGKEKLLDDTWRVAAATFFLVVLAPTMIALLIPRVARDLRVPILVYTAAIGTMLLMALTMDNMLVITGSALFTTSDAILSTEKFLLPRSPYSPLMQYAVWVLYYSGQLLIALGFMARG
ncbi:uncharacterized protein DNG_10458 [Cephalotrichum gorgonifer]|uniref:YhhN-like protein n=1 Tax=Cephalotrichum gorgonifer TaxID=2041049 RepID=A0AAE8N914_9PEZI|nr:uncharacterized protein DNG_10458 [Cephalotrichum gorgonifer]